MIIFDLDGTLADITHRRHLVDKTLRGGANWPEFYKQCEFDKPIAPAIALFKCLYHTTPVSKFIEIWSGRSDEVQWLTVDWLQRYIFGADFSWRDPEHPFYVRLRMRKAGDNTPDATLKEAWLDDLIDINGEAPEMVFDDRNCVVQMWRRRGIFCLQVADGDY